MRIAILGALHEEVGGVAARLAGTQERTSGGRRFVAGRWGAHDVVLALSRIGKVAAAATATDLILTHRPDVLVFIGVAGALDPSLRIGDIVIGRTLYQHDLDASPLFPPMEIPLTGVSGIDADLAITSRLTSAAAAFVSVDLAAAIPEGTRGEFGIGAPRVVSGVIASGDRFIASPRDAELIRERLPDVLCVEMEGAAVAQVCREYAVPFGVLRIISDRADVHAAIDFSRFVRAIDAVYALHILGRFLDAAP
ncbi:MAG: 5'-methylthioadenosine/adenosylhomocysteine nucleosidase [Phycisphaeraceae bacterium]|nr:5'-methylthioadenosine/adenosylhomocysteine nucleosidase [Phycisphaeraceae bacterium]